MKEDCHDRFRVSGRRSDAIGHNDSVPIRGLLIVMALLVVILSGVSTSQRAVNTKTDPPATTTARSDVPKPSPPTSATLPADGKVSAKPGQTVKLTVRSDTPDVAAIPKLGLSTPVGPGVAGEITLVAPSSGRFKVELQIARRSVGELVVDN